MNLIYLNSTQKILFYSAMSAIIIQILCIFCLLDKNQKFKLDCCIGYILFSALAYICYYQLVIPN